MGCSSWRFEKGGGSNECDGSRRAHIELWVPCRCMKVMESDWLGHITWKKVEVKIKVSNLKRLDKGVKACNILQHLQNMSQAPHSIGSSALENKEQG